MNSLNIYDLLIHHVYPRKRCFSDTNLGKYAKFHSLEGTLPYLFFFWYTHKTTGAINTPHGNTTHHYHLLLLQHTPPIREGKHYNDNDNDDDNDDDVYNDSDDSDDNNNRDDSDDNNDDYNDDYNDDDDNDDYNDDDNNDNKH
jgi:hypothetical protein